MAEILIDITQSNYNFDYNTITAAMLAAAGGTWPTGQTFRIKIESGVTLVSKSSTQPLFYFGPAGSGLGRNTIILENHGTLYGRGGNGVGITCQGAWYDSPSAKRYVTDGVNGGDVIKVDGVKIYLQNYGTIAPGGGGGGILDYTGACPMNGADGTWFITGNGGAPLGLPGSVFGSQTGRGSVLPPIKGVFGDGTPILPMYYATDWGWKPGSKLFSGEYGHYTSFDIWIARYSWATGWGNYNVVDISMTDLNNTYAAYGLSVTSDTGVSLTGNMLVITRGAQGSVSSVAQPAYQPVSGFRSFNGGGIGANAPTSGQGTGNGTTTFPIAAGVSGRSYVVVNGGVISTSGITPTYSANYSTPMKGDPVRQGDYDNIKTRLGRIIANNPAMQDIPGANQLFSNNAPGTYYYTIPSGVSSVFVTACAGGGGGAGSYNGTIVERYGHMSHSVTSWWYQEFPAKFYGGSGASGGYVVNYKLNVTPGQVLKIVVGQGGAGNTGISTGLITNQWYGHTTGFMLGQIPNSSGGNISGWNGAVSAQGYTGGSTVIYDNATGNVLLNLTGGQGGLTTKGQGVVYGGSYDQVNHVSDIGTDPYYYDVVAGPASAGQANGKTGSTPVWYSDVYNDHGTWTPSWTGQGPVLGLPGNAGAGGSATSNVNTAGSSGNNGMCSIFAGTSLNVPDVIFGNTITAYNYNTYATVVAAALKYRRIFSFSDNIR
jgi:hypothetical protein